MARKPTYEELEAKVKEFEKEAAKRKPAEQALKESDLRSSVKERCKLENIVGKSQPIQQVYDLISMAATSNASVVICGESGTGKELVTQAIHERSGKRNLT